MTLFEKYPKLEVCRSSIEDALQLLITTYEQKGKLLICGNGGSASDSEHIAGELMKGFNFVRPLRKSSVDAFESMYGDEGKWIAGLLQQGLPAISLVSQTSLITAISNDIHGDLIFAQQVYAYGNPGDVFLGLSTSGNSKNVKYAVQTAKVNGLKSIGISGESGGVLKKLCDICICVPAITTPDIQELHLPVYHYLCAGLEEHFFSSL